MKNLIAAIPLLIAGMLLAAFPIDDVTAQGNSSWQTFSVDSKSPELSNDLIQIDDSFRVLIAGGNLLIKPLPPLRGRWGASSGYRAILREREFSKLYCGTIELRDPKKHHDIEHGLTVSVLRPGEELSLYFWPTNGSDDNYCTFDPGHGGRAHAEN